ncbi:hypothetical protein VTI28DRAFT_504 [Corynascus sepedonium]
MNPTADPTSRPHSDPSDALYPIADDGFVPHSTPYPFEPPGEMGYWGAGNNLVLPTTATYQHDHRGLPTGPPVSMPPDSGFGSYHEADMTNFNRGSTHSMLSSPGGDEHLLNTSPQAPVSLSTESMWWMGLNIQEDLQTHHGINLVPVPIDAARHSMLSAGIEPTMGIVLPDSLRVPPEAQPPNPLPQFEANQNETQQEQHQRRHSIHEVEQTPAEQGDRRQAPARTVAGSPITKSPSPQLSRRASASTVESSSEALGTNHKSTVRARAALRYRAKTHMRLATLELAEQEAGTQNQALRACADQLRQEVFKLKNELLEQSTCDCPLIRGFLAKEAERVFHTIRERGALRGPDPGGPSSSGNLAATGYVRSHGHVVDDYGDAPEMEMGR